MLNQFREVYDKRWKKSIGTQDDDILVFEKPKRQVEFFYLLYNKFIADVIQSEFKEPKNIQLLELGCGRATSSIYQAITLGVSVHPTDYSDIALDVAKRNLKKYGVVAEPEKADVYELPYEDNIFDVVISLGVMEHITHPLKAYQEMYRVLKPGGIALSMNVPERNNIQRIATPINRVLSKIEILMNSKSQQTWLDKATRSKTDGVYRSNSQAEQFCKILVRANFFDCSGIEFNPFPTFSPLPKAFDLIVVKLYQLILCFRKFFLKMPKPEYSSIKNSRCHFVIGKKLKP